MVVPDGGRVTQLIATEGVAPFEIQIPVGKREGKGLLGQTKEVFEPTWSWYRRWVTGGEV